ncbi:MAG: helix-hairpin-helix domain-containing protein [bacterium]|nr:helix-hairpin-helix domain-containing protein [bacterium]
MKRLKTLILMVVVLSVVAVSAVSGYGAEGESSPNSEKVGKSDLINVNTAGADELRKLPRIGPKMSQRIIDYREKNGNFKRIQDLMKVTGIGEKTFKGFEDMITVGTKKAAGKKKKTE